MKTVVTGGAGFIGSHLVDELLRGENEVLVLDDFSTGQEHNLTAAKKHGKALEIGRVDICSSSAAAAIAKYKPDVVFHLAAQMNVRRSVTEPVFDSNVNVLGTVNLLEASRLSGIKKFIFASSGGAIYGEQERFPASETHPTKPESAYGVSKLCAENYLSYFSKIYKFSAVALRFGNVYGPRQNSKGEAGVVSIFIERMLSGEPIRINGDGKQTRDFVYVADVVKANKAVFERQSPNRFSVYNVGTGKESSVLELAEILRTIADGPEAKRMISGGLKTEFGSALPGEQRRSVIDCSQLKTDHGWSASVGFQDGVSETFQSFATLPVK